MQLRGLESHVEAASSASSRSISLVIDVVKLWKDCVSVNTASSMIVLATDGGPGDALSATLESALTFFPAEVDLLSDLNS